MGVIIGEESDSSSSFETDATRTFLACTWPSAVASKAARPIGFESTPIIAESPRLGEVSFKSQMISPVCTEKSFAQFLLAPQAKMASFIGRNKWTPWIDVRSFVSLESVHWTYLRSSSFLKSHICRPSSSTLLPVISK